MANAQQAVEKVRAFLAHNISLEDLEDWSASYIHNIHRVGDAKAQEVAHLIRSILNAFEDDATEAALRRELASAIHPFSPSQPTLVLGELKRKPIATANPIFYPTDSRYMRWGASTAKDQEITASRDTGSATTPHLSEKQAVA